MKGVGVAGPVGQALRAHRTNEKYYTRTGRYYDAIAFGYPAHRSEHRRRRQEVSMKRDRHPPRLRTGADLTASFPQKKTSNGNRHDMGLPTQQEAQVGNKPTIKRQ